MLPFPEFLKSKVVLCDHNLVASFYHTGKLMFDLHGELIDLGFNFLLLIQKSSFPYFARIPSTHLSLILYSLQH